MGSLWDNFKHSNLHIMGLPEEERARHWKSEKIMKESLHNLVRRGGYESPGSTRVPRRMDARRPTPRHIMPKVGDKERILKAAEGQVVAYRGVPIGLSALRSKL